ncbi:MAG: MauE/DoxX family redox-associated membrane protein [Acidimicrobiales bacterium]
MELIAPYLAACGLLVAAGLAKALRPADTARALAGLAGPSGLLGRRHRAGRRQRAVGDGRPASGALRAAVRFGALVEAALGLAGLVVLVPGVAAGVAASYAGFCVFVLYARRRGGVLATCGCFGSLDTPPTGLHAALDAGVALAAAWVALHAPGGWAASWFRHQPWSGVPIALEAVACAWLSALCMAAAARVVLARRLLAGRPVHPAPQLAGHR